MSFNAVFSRRQALTRFTACGAAAVLCADALAGAVFQTLGNCVSITLTPEFYNVKTGRWCYYIADRYNPDAPRFRPFGNPQPNVMTRVLVKDIRTKLPKKGARVDVYAHKPGAPWDFKKDFYGAQTSDSSGYATFHPFYLAPGTWDLRYVSNGAVDVFRTIRV